MRKKKEECITVSGILQHSVPVICMTVDACVEEVTLYTGCQNGQICAWDLSTLNRVKILKGHGSCVNAIASESSIVPFSQRVIVSGSNDSTIRCWSVQSGKCVCILRGHTSDVKCIAIGGSNFVSGSADFTVRVWDKLSFACRQVLVHGSSVTSISFCGTTLFTSSKERVLRMWKATPSPATTTSSVSGDMMTITGEVGVEYVKYTKIKQAQGHLDTPMQLSIMTPFSKYGLLYSVGREGDIKEWDTSNLTNTRHIKNAHFEEGLCVTTTQFDSSYLPGQGSSVSYLLSGGSQGEVILWDPLSLECVREIQLHTAPVTSLLCTDSTLFTSSKDGNVKILDLRLVGV